MTGTGYLVVGCVGGDVGDIVGEGTDHPARLSRSLTTGNAVWVSNPRPGADRTGRLVSNVESVDPKNQLLVLQV